MRFLKGLLRFFRSVAIGTLPVLLFAIIMTFCYKPEFLSRDGLMMIRDQIAIGTRRARPPAEIADRGHDTIPPPNPSIARIAALARRGDYDAPEAIYRDDPDAYFFFNDSSPDLGTHLDTWIGARLRFSPNGDGVREDYGYALIKLRHYDKAARELDRAPAADPCAPRALRLRGDAAYRLGAFAEAGGFYERSKVYDPGRAWTWFRVGIIKREHTNDLPGSIENLRRAVELIGDWPAYRYGFGVALDPAGGLVADRPLDKNRFKLKQSEKGIWARL